MSGMPWSLVNRAARSVSATPLFFCAIFSLAAFLRFRGLNWDDGHLLHPDERFLVMVQGAVKWVSSWAEYFDTSRSTLNPHNVGYGFYVYGTFPLFLIRGLQELLIRFDIPSHLFGRVVSGVADLGTCVALYFSGRLLGGRAVAIVAMLLCTVCALHIQQAHFGAVDTLGTFVVSLVLLLALVVAERGASYTQGKLLMIAALAGALVGTACAVKINLGLVGVLIPLGLWAGTRSFKKSIVGSLAAGVLCLLFFRVLQPYAFEGPGFWGLALNPKWTANLVEIRRLSVATVGFPPAVQWVDRSFLFGPWNAFAWGLGAPLGFLVVVSLVWSSWSAIREKNLKIVMLVVWATLGILIFSVFLNNATLRYLLPVYPAFFLLSAATAVRIWAAQGPGALRSATRLIVVVCILGGGAWGIGVSSIYVVPHSRVAASNWILDNIPSAISLEGRSDSGFRRFPVPLPKALTLAPGAETVLNFGLPENLQMEGVLLPKVKWTGPGSPEIDIRIEDGGKLVAEGRGQAAQDSRGVLLSFAEPVHLRPNNLYQMRLSNRGEVGATVEYYRIAHETDWDDGLPLRIRGLDPYGGMYEGAEKLEIYWEDNNDKKERFERVLKQSDFIFMTSNRQWGSVGRLKETFPITNEFYRRLAGCNDSESVPSCYEGLTEKSPQGSLGFRLVRSFTSYPTFLGLSIPDQAAEEAFTVYDHPKVLLFARLPTAP